MATFGDWLRATRERQLRVDGQPWSQDDFLDELQRATDWRLHRPNYSNYETGKTIPKADTRQRLVAFWMARGEPAYDPGPEPGPTSEPPDLATAVMTLATVVEGMRAEQAAWRRGIVAALEASEGPAREALLAALVPRPLEPSPQ